MAYGGTLAPLTYDEAKLRLEAIDTEYRRGLFEAAEEKDFQRRIEQLCEWHYQETGKVIRELMAKREA